MDATRFPRVLGVLKRFAIGLATASTLTACNSSHHAIAPTTVSTVTSAQADLCNVGTRAIEVRLERVGGDDALTRIAVSGTVTATSSSGRCTVNVTAPRASQMQLPPGDYVFTGRSPLARACAANHHTMIDMQLDTSPHVPPMSVDVTCSIR